MCGFYVGDRVMLLCVERLEQVKRHSWSVRQYDVVSAVSFLSRHSVSAQRAVYYRLQVTTSTPY